MNLVLYWRNENYVVFCRRIIYDYIL